MDKIKAFFQNKKLLWITVSAVCLLAAAIVLIVILAGGFDPLPTDDPASTGKENYALTLKTEGGLILSDVEVFVYADSGLNDLYAVGKTNANGTYGFEGAANGTYYAVLQGVPAGYEYAASYQMYTDTPIQLKAKLLASDDLAELSLALGDVMFDFTVTDINGTQYTLSKLLETKKAVVLNFWYTQCVPCKAEFPFLQEAYGQYSDQIAVLAVNPTGETEDAIAQFCTQNGLTLPAAKVDAAWADALKIQASPTTVVIDRYGAIGLIHVGSIDNAQTFADVFEFFCKDGYVQQTVGSIYDLPVTEAEEGSAENPFEFGGTTEFEVEVDGGETVYCDVYKVSGMQLTVNDANVSILYNEQNYTPENGVVSFGVTTPDTYTPVKLAITNTGSVKKTFKVAFSFLPGTMSNPLKMQLGDFAVNVEADNDQGVYYTYTATEAGKITVKCTGATAGVQYTFTLYNLTSYAYRTLDADGQDNTLTIDVKAGDELQFSAGTLPDENNKYPAATLNFTVSFEKSETPVDPSDDPVTNPTQGGNTGSNSGETTGGNTNDNTETTGPAEDQGDKLTYKVTVTDPDGKGLSGVTVTFSGTKGDYTASTNASGVASINLPKASYTVTVTAPEGYVDPGYTERLTKTDRSVTFALKVEPPAGYRELYVGYAYILSSGANSVKFTPNEDNISYFVFNPTTSGQYRFTTSNGEILYFGNTPNGLISDCTSELEHTTNSMVITIKDSQLTATYVVGVKNASGNGTVTVERIGAPTIGFEDYAWVEYKGSHTPSSNFTKPSGAMTFVDITGSFTYVLGGDGFYHKDSATGPIIYMDFDDATYISLQDVLNNGVGIRYAEKKANDEWSKEDYTPLVQKYVDAADSATKAYPLTQDLVYILQQFSKAEHWFDADKNGYLITAEPNLNPDIAWMFACFYCG